MSYKEEVALAGNRVPIVKLYGKWAVSVVVESRRKATTEVP